MSNFKVHKTIRQYKKIISNYCHEHAEINDLILSYKNGIIDAIQFGNPLVLPSTCGAELRIRRSQHARKTIVSILTQHGTLYTFNSNVIFEFFGRHSKDSCIICDKNWVDDISCTVESDYDDNDNTDVGSDKEKTVLARSDDFIEV